MRRPSRRALMALVAVAATAWAVVTVVTAHERPLTAQPGPDSYEYADAAWQLAHGHGYLTTLNENTLQFTAKGTPPRYPFGTSIALAPFAATIAGFPHAEQVGAKAIVVLYVLVVVAAAWVLGGSLAAAIAALLVGLSPFATGMAGLILSDPLAALLTVAMLITLTVRFRGRHFATGVLSGALVSVRLLGVVTLPAALLAVQGWRRRWQILLGAVPFLAAIGLYQWLTFGSPFQTGYSFRLPGFHELGFGYALHPFDHEGPFIIADKLHGSLLNFVCPCGVGGSMSAMSNLAFYPLVAAGFFWVVTPPLGGIVGLVQLVRHRGTPAGRYGLTTVALTLVFLIFYSAQGARYVGPLGSILLVYCATGLADAARWSAAKLSPWRGTERILRAPESVHR